MNPTSPNAAPTAVPETKLTFNANEGKQLLDAAAMAPTSEVDVLASAVASEYFVKRTDMQASPTTPATPSPETPPVPTQIDGQA